MKSVEVMQVIRTNLLKRGKGVEDDPVRLVEQYWNMDGDLLIEHDHYVPHPDYDKMKEERDYYRDQLEGCMEVGEDIGRRLEEAVNTIANLTDALQWTAGSADFGPEGQAREGWLKIADPAINDGIVILKENGRIQEGGYVSDIGRVILDYSN